MIGIFVLVVFASGCTASGGNSYSNSGVNFNYPKNWTLNDSSWQNGTGWIDIQDPQNNNTYCKIYSNQISIDNAEIIKSGNNITIISEKQVEINGMKGSELIFTSNIKNLTTSNSNEFDTKAAEADLRGAMLQGRNILNDDDTEREFMSVILEKSPNNYVLTFSALPEDFNTQKPNFDLILSSFNA